MRILVRFGFAEIAIDVCAIWPHCLVNVLSDHKPNRFQIDLRGIIDLLSHHLYSGPGVFVRELLQNAVDAIRVRRQIEPQHTGRIEIEVIESSNGPTTLVFHDDGIGLTQEEVHRFLATIGQSSKRGSVAVRPDDFIGQFGIGLLSCFMVTDQITVLTRSARDDQSPGVEWRGTTEGTYSVRSLDETIPIGTQVFLQSAGGSADYYEPDRVLALAREYGEFLPARISFVVGERLQSFNSAAPWTKNVADPAERQELLEYGRAAFQREFLDVIPLKSQAGGATGVAYVLADAVHAGSRQNHRVYLKNMLLSTTSHDLLPDWAFFVQCVLNAVQLRPTASRESFYEDANLECTRDELGQCLRRYLVDIAQTQPARFHQLMAVHHLAVKALAVDDDACLQLFADWLPFETSFGTMTLGEFREQFQVIRYVPSRDQFRQIAQVAASESLAVINAGYVYDVEILQRLNALRPDIRVELFEADQLSDRFEELTPQEREETMAFERLCDVVLRQFKCDVEIAKFEPQELSALYVPNDDSNLIRTIEQTQDITEGLWTDVLGAMADELHSIYARLYLNYGNPLIQRICRLANREGQHRCIEMVYIQALLLGHFPLKQIEVKVLNDGLVGLIDWALKSGHGDGRL